MDLTSSEWRNVVQWQCLLIGAQLYSVLLCSRGTSWVFWLEPGKQHSPHSSVKRKVHCLSQRGAGLYRQKSLPLVPDWSMSRQVRTPNPWSLIGPKGSVLIGHNRASLIGQICATEWMGKFSILLFDTGFQELCYKGWLRWQKHRADISGQRQAINSVQTPSWSVVCMRTPV